MVRVSRSVIVEHMPCRFRLLSGETTWNDGPGFAGRLC